MLLYIDFIAPTSPLIALFLKNWLFLNIIYEGRYNLYRQTSVKMLITPF